MHPSAAACTHVFTHVMMQVSDLKYEKYLTAGLEKKYGKTAGKGSLVHPNAHNHGIMMEAVGKDARRPTGSARGAAKPMKGLQADVINLAKMHAEAIERERQVMPIPLASSLWSCDCRCMGPSCLITALPSQH